MSHTHGGSTKKNMDGFDDICHGSDIVLICHSHSKAIVFQVN